MSAHTLAQECLAGTLEGRLDERYWFELSRRPSEAERRAWRNSLKVLSDDLIEAGLGAVEVFIEYRLPLSSKRADAILAGEHPVTGEPSYVIVELKQWSAARLVPDTQDLCTVSGLGNRAMLHPVEQVRRYCDYLVDFTRALDGHEERVVGVAYLHNATRQSVDGLYDMPAGPHGRMFTGDERGAFRDYLRGRLSPVDGVHAADLLRASRISPSRQLMAVAAAEIREREQFILLDEQQIAYSLVVRAVERARASDAKEVIVVTGGPGSGKSVIALSLLGELSRQGYGAVHATGSQSFTTTLRKTAGRGSGRIQKLFQYFNSFTAADRNGIDVLICDEAHRMRVTSNNRFTPAARRSNRRQVEELLDAARVPVFLLDEHQVVRPGEMGTVREIDEIARTKNLTVRHVDLDAQFRSGGSRAYERWVLRLLGLEPGGPAVWEDEERFEVMLVQSPTELEKVLRAKQEAGYGARMTAGFCWPWTDPTADGELVDDVVIDGWSRPWNLKGDRSVGGAPPSALWATEAAGFGQVGCIYTAQGFEYDWNGVVFGRDLLWRDGAWVADRSVSHDKVVARASPEEFEALIKNTYKVLLTRGMVGTVLFSQDPETQALFRSLVGVPDGATFSPAIGAPSFSGSPDDPTG